MAEGAPRSLRMAQMQRGCDKAGIGEAERHQNRDRQEERRRGQEAEGGEDAEPGNQPIAEAGQRGEQQDGGCRGHRESTLSIMRSSALLLPVARRSSGLAGIVALRGGR